MWEPLFIAEITAGRDPRVRPEGLEAAPPALSVGDLLDRYMADYVLAGGGIALARQGLNLRPPA